MNDPKETKPFIELGHRTAGQALAAGPDGPHESAQVASDLTLEQGNPHVNLTAGEIFGRLAGIGILLLAVMGAFFFLAGWFNPHQLTQARFVDGFEKVNGLRPGFRRNHAKGVCVTGYFDSNGKGTQISKAVVFLPGRVPVIGRFSFGTGDPNTADAPGIPRGLGIDYQMSDGEEWRTTMINLPVFPFKDPQAFYDNMIASAPDPVTHQPDPEKQAAFMASHPEAVHALGVFRARNRRPASTTPRFSASPLSFSPTRKARQRPSGGRSCQNSHTWQRAPWVRQPETRITFLMASFRASFSIR